MEINVGWLSKKAGKNEEKEHGIKDKGIDKIELINYWTKH